VRPIGLLAGLVLALGGGCGHEPEPPPVACGAGPEAIERALGALPRPVRLDGGARVSDCVARALTDGELQQLGFVLTAVADRLAERATPRAAEQLGFLVGAVRRGAARSNGIHAELVRRLEGAVTYADPAMLRAARRGRAAGEARG
jgi:hypothetical protein